MGASKTKPYSRLPVACLGQCNYCPSNGAPMCLFCGTHYPTESSIQQHQVHCTAERPQPPLASLGHYIFKPLPSWNKNFRQRIKYGKSMNSTTYIRGCERTYDRNHSADIGGCPGHVIPKGSCSDPSCQNIS